MNKEYKMTIEPKPMTEKPEIKLDEYVKYNEIEPIPQDMLQ